MSDNYLITECPNCNCHFNQLGEDYGLWVPEGEDFTCPNCHKTFMAVIELKEIKKTVKKFKKGLKITK